MRCVVITPLGRPVEPEVYRIFAIESGPVRRLASSTDRGRLAAFQFREGDGTHSIRARAVMDNLRVALRDSAQRGSEARGVIREHHGRAEIPPHVRERRKFLHGQRIRRRNGRIRNARIHGRQSQQAMLNSVSGKNHQRFFRGKAAIEEAARQPTHAREGLSVGHRAPLAIRRALGKKNSAGRLEPPTIPGDR